MKKERNKTWSIEEHKKRHQELHKALDELVADWLAHQPLGSNKRFSNTTILELMIWSSEQTQNPSEKDEEKVGKIKER